jgi:hypothetical protein
MCCALAMLQEQMQIAAKSNPERMGEIIAAQ